MRYQIEKFEDFYKDGIDLFNLHWEEIARNKEEIKLNPDFESYIQLDELGRLLVTTVRDGDELVGYIINFIAPHLHYKDWLMSDNDILFIHPQYRKKGVFSSLLKFTIDCLKERGVGVIHIHMKTKHDFGPLLEKFGFIEIERNFELR